VGAHGFRRVERDHLAIHQHGDLVRQPEHDAHVVLHGQQSAPLGHLPDELDEARRLAAAHAGGRLVEQDHLRAARDRQPDLQRPLLRIGQVHRQHVAALVEVELVQQFILPPPRSTNGTK